MRRLSDEEGQTQWQWPYSAFGANPPSGPLKATAKPDKAMTAAPQLLKATSPKLELDLRYPGQMADEHSALHDNWQRQYQPLLGRYTQADPIGLAGGWNRFGYVGGNPLKFLDPNGLRVTVTYDHATGNLYIADDDTGAFYKLPAGSGGNPWGDPIPNGDYDILGHPDPDFFRLEPVDGRYGDDTHAGTGRGNFRLHKPGRTTGCIAAGDNVSWAQANKLIRATQADIVGVRSKSRNPFAPRTEILIRYGRVTVINSPR